MTWKYGTHEKLIEEAAAGLYLSDRHVQMARRLAFGRLSAQRYAVPRNAEDADPSRLLIRARMLAAGIWIRDPTEEETALSKTPELVEEWGPIAKIGADYKPKPEGPRRPGDWDE